MKLPGNIYREGVQGYTLIEMMVVVFVMAIIMGLSVPNLVAKARLDPLTKGVRDFEEACENAREIAILTGESMQVVIGSEAIHVEVAPNRDAGRWAGGERRATEGAETAEGKPRRKQPTPFTAELKDFVSFNFEGASVNLRLVDMKNENRLIIKFYPNGTCDQFEGELLKTGVGSYLLKTELMTGLVETKRIR